MTTDAEVIEVERLATAAKVRAAAQALNATLADAHRLGLKAEVELTHLHTVGGRFPKAVLRVDVLRDA